MITNLNEKVRSAAIQTEKLKGAIVFLQKEVEEKTVELQAREEAIKELTRAVEQGKETAGNYP